MMVWAAESAVRRNTARAGVYPVQSHASATSISCAPDPASRKDRRKKVADTSAAGTSAWLGISHLLVQS